MLRGLTFGLCLLVAGLLCLPSRAQLTMTGVGSFGGAGAAGPTFAGDVVASAYEWYGLDAYSLADRGNPLINVCNVGDVVCADMSSHATTGALVITTVGGSDCSVVTCTVKTMYDRSGALSCTLGAGAAVCNATQATPASRPTLIPSCVGGKPCLACSGTQGLASPLQNATKTQPLTISYVGNRNAATSAFGIVFAQSDFNFQIGWPNATNSLAAYAGTVATISTASTTDSTWHAVQNILQDASGAGTSIIYVDGSNNPGLTVGTQGVSASAFGICSPAGNSFTGQFRETGLWTVAFNGTQNANMNSSQHGRGGF
jgi:hypothetical protein